MEESYRKAEDINGCDIRGPSPGGMDLVLTLLTCTLNSFESALFKIEFVLIHKIIQCQH